MDNGVSVRTLFVWGVLFFSLFTTIIFTVGMVTTQSVSIVEHFNIWDARLVCSPWDSANCTVVNNLQPTFYIDKYGLFSFCRFYSEQDQTLVNTYCSLWNNNSWASQFGTWPCNACVPWSSTFGSNWISTVLTNTRNNSSAPDVAFQSKQQATAAFAVMGAMTAWFSLIFFAVVVHAHYNGDSIASKFPFNCAKAGWLCMLLTCFSSFLIVCVWGSIENNFSGSFFQRPNVPADGVKYGSAFSCFGTALATSIISIFLGIKLSSGDSKMATPYQPI